LECAGLTALYDRRLRVQVLGKKKRRQAAALQIHCLGNFVTLFAHLYPGPNSPERENRLTLDFYSEKV